MKLFTHCAHIEKEKDMGSARIVIEGDTEERGPYTMLLEAAILGTKMEELRRLLQDDPAILDRVMWECRGKDNPLHERATKRSPKERVAYRTLLKAAIRKKKKKELLELFQEDEDPPKQEDEDPPILDLVMSECRGKDNPLHVGALYGNVDFVKEILNRKPELNRELNSQGQSPLHVASASGHVEVVREILRKDADACFIRDRDGMIPLHLAAIQGRVEVLEALVKAEKITAFILTESGDPILHLCAKNKKFEALKKLIELVKDARGFLNLRDRDDNTILHLLSAKANVQVIKILVNTAAGVNAEKSTAADVNAENKDGFTPLDVSLVQNENILRGFRIRMFLIGKGAKRGGNNSLSFLVLLLGLDIEGDVDESWFAEALLVVAILMATVAFQARLNPPGGVWQDTGYHNATLLSPNALQSSPPKLVLHYAGESIMSYVDSGRYKFFSIFNDLMLALSLLVIQLLLLSYIFKSRRSKILAIQVTDISLTAMSATYFASATFFSSDKLHLLTCSLVLVSSMLLDISFAGRSFLLTGSQLFLLYGSKFMEFCKAARLKSCKK